MSAKKELFEYFFNRLVKGYRSVMGKEPEGLDLIKIKQEARQKLIDQNKVIDVDFGKPFGEEVNDMIARGEVNIGTANKTPPYTPSKAQTDFEIQTRLESDNAKAIEAFKKRNPKDDMATGGRAGYYGGGITNMVGEDLSEIGHGSDALMARNMQIAPGGQATTSTGLNYLLGQDNDTARVPYGTGKKVKGPNPKVLELMLNEKMSYEDAEKEFKIREKQRPYIEERMGIGPGPILEAAEGGRIGYNEGNMVLPKPKPPADPMVELNRVYNLYTKAGPGVSQETKKFLQQDFIQKLNEAEISQEAFMTDRMQKNFKAEGGIARLGFAGGGGMSKRGFLKLLGGSVATVTAFKTGLIKMLGKDSGAVTKKALDKFIVQEGAGAPAWLEPLVNKALKEGTDKTKALAIADGQIVKSLDTPTGNVDVYYDTRTGAVDIDYIGSGTTTMDEPLQMSYKPGVADEGTKGIKPDDEFSAVESIPEINQSSGNFSGSHKDLEFGENVSNNVEGLYSDTSELAKLGGKNPLIKEISESIQKKKFLKKMNDDPQQFAMENVSEYYD